MPAKTTETPSPTDRFGEIVMINPRDLVPNPENARTHSAEEVDELATIIETYGWRVPVIVGPDNMIISGHRRTSAAIMLKLKQVPCIDGSDMTPEEIKAFTLADNRTAMNAGWDLEALGAQLRELDEAGTDLRALGFSQQEIDDAVGGVIVDPNGEWDGMPEFKQDDIDSFRKVIVHFRSQPDVDEFAGRLGVDLTEKTKYVWFPPMQKEVYKDKGYEPKTEEDAA